MKRGRLSAGVGLALFVLVVLVALFVRGGGQEGPPVPGSTRSYAPEGRRALALLLARLVPPVEGWRQVPAALPAGPHALWMARPPSGALVQAGPDDEAVRVGMHALEHYADFVRGGGTLVVAGEDGLAFLADDLELDDALDLRIEDVPPRAGPVRLESGELVEAELGARFAPLDPGSPARAWATWSEPELSEEPAVVVSIPVGAGRAIVLADDGFLDNARIGAHEHALFAVRIAEDAVRGGRLLFDEYALGLWEPGTPLTVVTGPRLVLLTLHAVALAALWLWMRGAPRAFPRDPEPLETFSPVLRARAQARLAERAGRLGLLAAPLRRAALERLSAKAGLRLPRDAGVSEAALARLEARLAPARAARAREVLAARPVRTREDLERLDADLAALEAEGVA